MRLTSLIKQYIESITGMLWHHVHVSGIWLKRNALWQLTIKDLLTRHSIGSLVWKETPLSNCLVDSLWPLEPVGRYGFRHSRQTCKHKSRIPCPIFGEYRFPGNSQISIPVNIFIVFPIPASCFAQIPNPAKNPSRPSFLSCFFGAFTSWTQFVDGSVVS